jgi:colicin import membrane protein
LAAKAAEAAAKHEMISVNSQEEKSKTLAVKAAKAASAREAASVKSQEQSDKALAVTVAKAAAIQAKAAVKKQEESDKSLAAAAAASAETHEKSALRKQEEAAKKAASGPVKAEQAEKAASKKAADESAYKAKKAEEGFKAELASSRADVETTKVAGEKTLKAALKEANRKSTAEHAKKMVDSRRECEKMQSVARAALPPSAQSAKDVLMKKIGVLQDAVKGMEGELRRCQPGKCPSHSTTPNNDNNINLTRSFSTRSLPFPFFFFPPIS